MNVGQAKIPAIKAVGQTLVQAALLEVLEQARDRFVHGTGVIGLRSKVST